MIEEIKEQLNNMQRLVYEHIEPEMYESHVKYLLSIIEQYEHRMKITTVELQDWVRNFEVLVMDREYMDATKKIIADNYEFHLQAIRGN